MKIGKHYLVAYQHKADWMNFVETKLSTATHHRFNMRGRLLEVTTSEGDLEFYLGLNVSQEQKEQSVRLLQGCLFHTLMLLEGVYDEHTVRLLKSRIVPVDNPTLGME